MTLHAAAYERHATIILLLENGNEKIDARITLATYLETTSLFIVNKAL